MSREMTTFMFGIGFRCLKYYLSLVIERREWDDNNKSIMMKIVLIDISQLMLAAYHGHAELVKLLIEHGADPNSLNDKGQSPLAGAVFKAEDEVVEVSPIKPKFTSSFLYRVFVMVMDG